MTLKSAYGHAVCATHKNKISIINEFLLKTNKK